MSLNKILTGVWIIIAFLIAVAALIFFVYDTVSNNKGSVTSLVYPEINLPSANTKALKL